MSDKNIITLSANKFSEHYEKNPVTSVLLTALSLAVPQLAIGKEAIDRAVTKIQEERRQTFIDELATGEKYLTPEIIETEEFIHSFVVVYRAVINTYQREKIRRFSRILLSAIEKEELASDKFELFIRICRQLDDEELNLLKIMLKIELKIKNYSETEFVKFLWEQFSSEISKFFEKDVLNHTIFRLESMGLYQIFRLGMTVEGSREVTGKTTLLFKEFAEWIKFEDETNSFLYKDKDTTSD